MSDKPNPQAVAKTTDEKFMEFIPFGASEQEKIKLSVAIVKNLVCVKTKSGKLCSDTDAMKFMMMCRARRLNPFEGDAFLIGYDGKDGPTFSLITAHQAFLKRAEINPEYDGMKSGIIVDRDGQVMDLEGDFYLPGDKLLGGWATVYFKNRKQPMHKRVRLERFKKPFGIWLDDAAGMICKCAEADALRSSFPTMLGGLYLREEVAPEPKKLETPIFDSTPKPTVVDVQASTPTQPSPQFLLSEQCKKDGISEIDLLNYLDATFGLSVNSIAELGDESVGMIEEKWDEIVKDIKNSTQKGQI